MANPERSDSCCGPSDGLLQIAPCCGGGGNRPPVERTDVNAGWLDGSVATAVGEVPRARAVLGASDRLGGWKARWAIGRMRYSVPPGLYAVGDPATDSPVLVSANYKMSFDRLRSQLVGIDAWVLVLDTRGINVWCAAGKGTFGTDELVRRVEETRLAAIVSHRTLVVPQLAGPGVAAHKVKKRCGFRVRYGPVRCEDLAEFLAAGMKATSRMRTVTFPIRDRLALIPVELVLGAKFLSMIAVGLFLPAGFAADGYSWSRALELGGRSAVLWLAVSAGAIVLVPTLLPWLPGRAFAFKGFSLGLAFLPCVVYCPWFVPAVFGDWPTTLAWCLAIPTVSSFLAMNFTGVSTYTSLSGVRREMGVALPLQIASIVAAAGLWVAGRFL
jgi:acetyl-CoA decarbonylase/synthase complex subunit gamma